MSRRPWTSAEVRRLAEMLRAGAQRPAVAEALGRTLKALERGVAMARSMRLSVEPAEPHAPKASPKPRAPTQTRAEAQREKRRQHVQELASVHGQALVEGRAGGRSWLRLGSARGWSAALARDVATAWCATWNVSMPSASTPTLGRRGAHAPQSRGVRP